MVRVYHVYNNPDQGCLKLLGVYREEDDTERIALRLVRPPRRRLQGATDAVVQVLREAGPLKATGLVAELARRGRPHPMNTVCTTLRRLRLSGAVKEAAGGYVLSE
jgi:hypothetical protein